MVRTACIIGQLGRAGACFAANLRFACLLACLSLWGASGVAAQGTPAPQNLSRKEAAAYQRAIQHGLEEFEVGNFPEARAAFAQAHALQPGARTHRALGLVAFEMRHYGECIEQLGAALASTAKPLDAPMRQSTEELLLRARGLVARVHIEVTPSSSDVSVDGVALAPTAPQPIVLAVGDHLIEASAPGLASERRPLSVVGGEELHVAISLRAPGEPRPVSLQLPVQSREAPSPTDRAGERRWYKSPWLWTCVGLAAAGAAAGLAFGLRPDPSTTVAPSMGTTNTPSGGVLQALRSW